MQGQNVFAPAQPGFTVPVGKPKDWYHYPVRFAAVTNGTLATTSFNIDAGSDFYLTAITYFANVSSATAGVTYSTTPVPAVTLLVTDSGSNRQLMQNPVPLALFAGGGDHPHRLIYPRLFQRNSNIQIQLTSFDPTSYTNLYVNFEGFRIYGL